MKKRRFLLFVINAIIAALLFVSASLPWWGGTSPNLKSLPSILPFDTSYINSITPVSALLLAAAILAATGAIFAMKSMPTFGAFVSLAIAFFWFQSLNIPFNINGVGYGVWAVTAAAILSIISMVFIRPRHHEKKEKK